jgi:hypothetical protein
MSRPNALPVGPTRRADSSTSMPPPEPRSSTTSPDSSSASAVGLPHPREACKAAAGTVAASVSSYRSPETASVGAPQQRSGAERTPRASRPYLSFTISFTS